MVAKTKESTSPIFVLFVEMKVSIFKSESDSTDNISKETKSWLIHQDYQSTLLAYRLIAWPIACPNNPRRLAVSGFKPLAGRPMANRS